MIEFKSFRQFFATRRTFRFLERAFLLLVVIGSLLAITDLNSKTAYTGVLFEERPSRLSEETEEPALQRSDERHKKYLDQGSRNALNDANTESQRPVRVVIIFATKRSGSTLLGEFFNQNRGCFYLFEPLFPYTRYCDILRKERVALLKKLSDCDFSNSSVEYQKAFQATKHTDKNSKCMANNLCFSNRDKFLLYRYAAACKDKSGTVDFNAMTRFVADSSDCGYPLESSILSSLCSAAEFIVYKIIRICDLSDLAPLLSIPDLAIIHLVRDPRGILSSRLQLDNDELNRENLEEHAKKLCTETIGNINYAQSRDDQPLKWESAKFMRIRYEDLALNPLKSAYSIYSFLKRELPTSVKMWITNSFLKNGSQHKASSDPYSTVKNVYNSVNSWRKRLTMEEAFMIQKYCSESMAQLNYRDITSFQDMQDFNITTW